MCFDTFEINLVFSKNWNYWSKVDQTYVCMFMGPSLTCNNCQVNILGTFVLVCLSQIILGLNFCIQNVFWQTNFFEKCSFGPKKKLETKMFLSTQLVWTLNLFRTKTFKETWFYRSHIFRAHYSPELNTTTKTEHFLWVLTQFKLT